MKFQSSVAMVIAATASTTLAAPAAVFERAAPISTILPFVTSNYHVKTGQIDFNTGRGLVDKSTGNNGDDHTTLVTFQVPQQYSGNQCQIVFDLPPAAPVSGTGRLDVFTSIAPATTNTLTWPQGNLRDDQLGRLIASPGERASWEQDFGGFSPYPCSQVAGQYVAAELVGVGDNDHVEWNGYTDGPKIIIS